MADLAARELEPQARDEVRSLLGRSMATAATWADEIKRQRRRNSPWHYVNIPLDAGGYDTTRDCGNDDCIIAALEQQWQILRDPARSKTARTEALQYVIRLVADLHQPLHCADRGDRGGNAVEVRWFTRRSNLHRVWDHDILAQARLSEPQLVAALRTRIQPGELEQARQRSRLEPERFRDALVRWANESHQLAREVAYILPADGHLNTDYYERSAPVAERQLVRAGLRLVQILNAAFGAEHAAQPAGEGNGAGQGSRVRSDRLTEPPTALSASSSCIPSDQCCRICSKGQACGASCISTSYTCRKGSGCACDAADVCQ